MLRNYAFPSLLALVVLAGRASAVSAAALGEETNRKGFEITQVYYGTTAWREGLKPGDVVVSLNGRPVRSAADLKARAVPEAMNVSYDPVDRVQLGVVDGITGKERQVTVYPRGGRIGVDGNLIDLGDACPYAAR